ncbi:MAG: FAD binding domain-containing protein [Treponema sp.]|jgi:CO/xanthine dehydrogenase FAD-binding subunit|nr:FAD binding domain-containing protein [Treponema sp.]
MEAGTSYKKLHEHSAPSQVFFPANFQELFSTWSRFPEAIPYAGGTDLIRNQGMRVPVLPEYILSLDKIEELKNITRTEKYIEMGAMVRLNEIINLGKIVPVILTKTLEGIGGSLIRNLATIGGNLCHHSYRMDASAPMTALDALYELRTASSARWVSSSRFFAVPGKIALEPQELLTRIRVPLDEWTYSVYRKFKPQGSDESGGVMVFLLKNQKDTLTDLRIVYTRSIILHDRNSETFLIGKQLPLKKKEALVFLDKWRQYLNDMADTMISHKYHFEQVNISQLSAQIMAFIENLILEITE